METNIHNMTLAQVFEKNLTDRIKNEAINKEWDIKHKYKELILKKGFVEFTYTPDGSYATLSKKLKAVYFKDDIAEWIEEVKKEVEICNEDKAMLSIDWEKNKFTALIMLETLPLEDENFEVLRYVQLIFNVILLHPKLKYLLIP